ncbi:methionine/alanine import family NSS transporter small subunit [Thalassiella azotivora]
MGTSAVVMLLVGAVFLWGGFLLAAVTYWRSSKRDAGLPDDETGPPPTRPAGDGAG